jgi:hypothetical protein
MLVFALFIVQTEAHQDTLVSEQASFILERSGIGNIYNTIQDQPTQKVRFCVKINEYNV